MNLVAEWSNISAVLNRADQIGRAGIVDDQRQTVPSVGDGCNGVDVWSELGLPRVSR